MSHLLYLILIFCPVISQATYLDVLRMNETVYDKLSESESKIQKIDKYNNTIDLLIDSDPPQIVKRKPQDLVRQVRSFNGLSLKSEVSFYSERLGDFDYGIVNTLYENGLVFFQVREFKNDGSYFVFQRYKAHVSHLGLPIEYTNDETLERKICFNGHEADLATTFSNGTAKLIFGDFFGHRIFIFEKWRVVELSEIESCKI